MTTAGSDRGATRIDGSVVLLVAVALALAVYRPDRLRPLDILDFGEFVPILKTAEGWTNQFTSLVAYGVEQHARPYLVQCLFTVLKWQAFGSWTPGWQFTSAALMVVIVTQLFVLLRRLGATGAAAALGASVYLFAPAAARGWVRLTLAEPLGLVVALAIALRATTYQRRERWNREVWWFAVGAVIVILNKEMAAPTLMFPIVIAVIVRADGTVGRPAWTRRNVVLAVAVGLASLVALAPLAIVYFSAQSTALASQYGTQVQSVGTILAIWLTSFLPFNPLPGQPSILWTGAIIGIVGLVAFGGRLMHEALTSQTRIVVSLALLLPLLGVAVYAPWPTYEERYAFPYLLGASLLFSWAATGLDSLPRLGRAVLAASWIPALVLGASDAAAYVARTDTAQRAIDTVIERVAASPHSDSVYVATNAAPVLAWTGFGPTLGRLAAATDRPWPPAENLRCSEIDKALRSPARIVVVAFASQCQTGARAGQSVVVHYRYIDWKLVRLVHDSVSARVLASPAKAMP